MFSFSPFSWMKCASPALNLSAESYAGSQRAAVPAAAWLAQEHSSALRRDRPKNPIYEIPRLGLHPGECDCGVGVCEWSSGPSGGKHVLVQTKLHQPGVKQEATPGELNFNP